MHSLQKASVYRSAHPLHVQGCNVGSEQACFGLSVYLATGQVAVRKKVGGGSFVCGLKRVLTPEDTLECHAAIGILQTLRIPFCFLMILILCKLQFSEAVLTSV